MKFIVNQTVISTEIMVKKIAAQPILFDFSSGARIYLTAGQIPKGGKKKLTR